MILPELASRLIKAVEEERAEGQRMSKLRARDVLLNGHLWVFVLAPILVLGTMAVLGAQKIDQDRAECTERGGIQVRTYGGFACVQGSLIEMAEH